MLQTKKVMEPGPRNSRWTLGLCGGAHCLHDGLTDAFYVLLPIWHEMLGLSLMQVGLLKTILSGCLAGFQIPAGFLSERLGIITVLTAGTMIAGAGYALTAFSNEFISLLIALAIVGLGCAVQHPLSSALVSNAYDEGNRRSAMGIYNFSGDLGKMIFPTSIAIGIGAIGWKMSSITLGIIGILGGLVIGILLNRFNIKRSVKQEYLTSSSRAKIWGIKDPIGFGLLSSIGSLDTAIRYAFLPFLPFLLISKGADVETVGFALTLVFAGGALGKYSCGVLADRLGIIRLVVATEVLTAFGIVALIYLPLLFAFLLLPLVGLVMNGTSSVLYGTVTEFVAKNKEARAFSLYYTIVLASGAIAPLIFGLIGDFMSVQFSLHIVAIMALIVTIMCPFLSFRLRCAYRQS